MKDLSGGQKRRLDLALGIVGDPRLLFLDEPTTGFDPTRPARGVGRWSGPARGQHHHPADHALHGRGAAAGRPGRGDRRRDGSSPRARPATIGGGTPPGPASGSHCPRLEVEDLPSSHDLGPNGRVTLEVDTRAAVLARAQPARRWNAHAGLPRLAEGPPSLEDVCLRLTGSASGPAGDEPPPKPHSAAPSPGAAVSAAPAAVPAAAARAAPSAHRAPGPLRAALVLAQPAERVFTFVFPVVIIVIFGAVFSNGRPDAFTTGSPGCSTTCRRSPRCPCSGPAPASWRQRSAFRRPDGILKRVRATPLPAWVYFVGSSRLHRHQRRRGGADRRRRRAVRRRAADPLGRDRGDPRPRRRQLCSLGVAVASLVRNAEAAPAVVQSVLFPLVFTSGTYSPIHSQVLNDIASTLPVRPSTRR